VRTAARSITAQVADTTVRADLLASLAFFAKLASPALEVLNLIGVDNMRESAFFDDVVALGRLEARRADILEVLETRFGAKKATKYGDRLKRVADPSKLSELLRAAVTSESLTAFGRALRS